MPNLPPTIKTRYEDLNGFAVQGTQRREVSGVVERRETGEVEFNGEGPLDWVLGPRGRYRAELNNQSGWSVTCEDCINTHTDFNADATGVTASFTAHIGRATASYGEEPDPNTSEAFAVFTGSGEPFCGDCFDQCGKRSLIDLGFTERAGELIGVPLGGGKNEIGYIRLQSEGKVVEDDWRIINRIRPLTSLAYASFIGVPWYARFGTNGETIVEMYPQSQFGSSPGFLYVTYPYELGKLLRSGWSVWDTTAQGLELVHLINQYILTKNQTFVDASLILGCVWMEAFKHQYAQNVRRYGCTRGGYFLKPGSTRNRYSFIELVEEGMRHFGMPDPYLGFESTRNEVIHTGVITGLMEEKLRIKLGLERAIEEFFLTLFRFNGYVWDYGSNTWVERNYCTV